VGVPTDVGDIDAVEALMDAARDRFGSLDGLVTAAGFGTVMPMLEQPLDEILEMVQTDLLGTIFAIRSAVARMGRGSQVVTVASSVAGAPLPSMPGLRGGEVGGGDPLREHPRRAGRPGHPPELPPPRRGGDTFSGQLGAGRARSLRDGRCGTPPIHWAIDDLAEVAGAADGPDLRRVMRSRDIAPSVLFAFELPERSKGTTLQVL